MSASRATVVGQAEESTATPEGKRKYLDSGHEDFLALSLVLEARGGVVDGRLIPRLAVETGHGGMGKSGMVHHGNSVPWWLLKQERRVDISMNMRSDWRRRSAPVCAIERSYQRGTSFLFDIVFTIGYDD